LDHASFESAIFINWKAARNAGDCAAYKHRKLTTQQVLKLTNDTIRTCSVGAAWACLVQLMRSGISANTEIYTALISRCVKLGQIKQALGVLKDMQRNGVKRDAITYEVLVQACKKHGMTEELQDLYADMQRDGIARNAAICGRFNRGQEGEDNVQRFTATNLRNASWPDTEACLKEMKKARLEPNRGVRMAALPNYPNERLVSSSAWEMLNELSDLGIARDLIDLGQLVATCVQFDFHEQANDLLREAAASRWNILKPGLGCKPGKQTIDFRLENLEVTSTQRRIPKAFQLSVALFNYHCSQDAIGSGTLFRVGTSDPNVKAAVAACMRKIHLAPVAAVELDGTRNPEWLECGRTALRRCLQRGAIDIALTVVREMGEKGFFPEAADCRDLIHACGNTGRLKDAIAIFRELFASKFEPKVSICNAMIDVYGQHRYIDDAIQIFDSMFKQGVRADAGSYFAVIAACQRAGEPLHRITPMIDAAVKGHIFNSALGYAEEVSILEFSASAIAAKQAEGAPHPAVSAHFLQAMFMYHHSKGHVDPEKTRLVIESKEARDAIEEVMRTKEVGLDPAGTHKHMFDEPKLT
jgi:pentatricopeptide repeat protein